MGQKRGIADSDKVVILTMFLFKSLIMRKTNSLKGGWLKKFPVLVNITMMERLKSRFLIIKHGPGQGHRGFEVWGLTNKGRKCAKVWVEEIPRLSRLGYVTNALVEMYRKKYGSSTQETEVISR